MKFLEDLNRYRAHRELLFWGIAALLLLLALGYTAFAIGSLAANLRAGLAEPQHGFAPTVRFNTDLLAPLIESGKLQPR